MILLAFFFPLAVYLLVLGFINRRRYPLLVSGVWDGIGLVFGVSGFLFFAGPAIFSALRERWRLYWLLGRGGAPSAGPDGAWQFWIFLSILYFLGVAGGVAFYFWRQRHLTAIYNADAKRIEQALTQICERLGLNPMRSGSLFLFGLSLELTAKQHGGDVAKIQRQAAILELESFAPMRHVTLRWDPADSPLRQPVERELAEELARMPAEESPLGGWLLTIGCLLLAAEMAGVFLVVLIRAFLH